MAQKKLLRFAQIKTFSNVLEYPADMKGKWGGFFHNNNPIVLELACGRGEYAVGLARLNLATNCIGIDIKGNRMYIGAKKALEAGLSNVAFLRTQIEMLADYFAPGEVDSIWITFPDPQLRTSKSKKRLTHPRFLRIYQQVIKPGGYIHLKTDSPALYAFTLKVIELYKLVVHDTSENVYGRDPLDESLKIKTHYESLDIAQSNKIFYIKFSLPAPIPENDGPLLAILKEAETTAEEIK